MGYVHGGSGQTKRVPKEIEFLLNGVYLKRSKSFLDRGSNPSYFQAGYVQGGSGQPKRVPNEIEFL